MALGEKVIKLGQYADDTFLVLDGSINSLSETLQTFKQFEKVSGLAINIDKTQVIKLGSANINLNCPIVDIPYTKTFKLLGIHFSTNLEEMYELNFRDKVANIRQLVRTYQARNFSITGRITIVKMYMLPKLIHVLAVLPLPNIKHI